MVFNFDGGVTNQPEAHWGAASSYAAPVLSGLLLNANQLDNPPNSTPIGASRNESLSKASVSGEFGTQTLMPAEFLAKLTSTKSTAPSAITLPDKQQAQLDSPQDKSD
jgi:hypothetical protein